MSYSSRNLRNENSVPVAAAMPLPGFCEGEEMRTKLLAVRDTLIVLALQIVFRMMMWLRRWNF